MVQIQVKGEELKNYIESKGYNISYVSRESGMSESYLQKALKQNRIGEPVSEVIKQKFNIDVKQFTAQNNKHEQENCNEKAKLYDYDVLYRIIYNATYKAVKNAMIER